MSLTKWIGLETCRRPLNVLRRVTRPIVGFFIVVIADGALPFCPKMTKRTRISVNIITFFWIAQVLPLDLGSYSTGPSPDRTPLEDAKLLHSEERDWGLPKMQGFTLKRENLSS